MDIEVKKGGIRLRIESNPIASCIYSNHGSITKAYIEGDTIHYDMQNYRYLCKSCQEKLCAQMNENCEVVEGIEGSGWQSDLQDD